MTRKKDSRFVAAALAAIISVGILSVPVSAEGNGVSYYPSAETGDGASYYPASDTERSVPYYSAWNPFGTSSHDLNYPLPQGIERYYKSLKTVSNKSTQSYRRENVYVRSTKLSINGIIINGTPYVPFRSLSNALGGSYTYTSSQANSVMRLSGLEISATAGCYVTYANGRALFSETPTVIMSDGRMYLPADVLAKALGMTLSSKGDIRFSGNVKPLAPASNYYRDDEVFWLARIIHAESVGEPLLGQIAVGNVVLNRVKSAYYPNTVYGVIFDKKYGVQFSPILDGSIYNTPSYNSILAAKICLEGYNVSEGAFFFLEPRLSTSNWIPKSREYAFTIGNHDFYK